MGCEGCSSGGCGSGYPEDVETMVIVEAEDVIKCQFLMAFEHRVTSGQESFKGVEVRFKGSRKEFFRNEDNLPLATGDVVAVEGNPGHDIGIVSLVAN